MPVDITNDFPRPLIKFKPDWNKAKVTGTRELDYYESDHALGYLFRNTHLDDLANPLLIDLITLSSCFPPVVFFLPTSGRSFPWHHIRTTPLLGDVISQAIAPFNRHTLDVAAEKPEAENKQAKGLYDPTPLSTYPVSN